MYFLSFFFATLAGLASVKMKLDANETYTVLINYRDQQHIQLSQHFMPRLARTRLAKTRKSDLNLKSPLQSHEMIMTFPAGISLWQSGRRPWPDCQLIATAKSSQGCIFPRWGSYRSTDDILKLKPRTSTYTISRLSMIGCFAVARARSLVPEHGMPSRLCA